MRTVLVFMLFVVAIALTIWRRPGIFRLKRKTKRKLNRLKAPLNVFVMVVGILGVFLGLVIDRQSLATTLRTHIQPLITRAVPSAPLLPNWAWIASLVLLILLVILIIVFLGARLLSARRSEYLEEIDFGKNTETTVDKARAGLLNTEKAQPFYVYAAPKMKEVQVAHSLIIQTRFLQIRGGPGEGKSMLAYQVAYKLRQENGYRCYRLKVEALEGKQGTRLVHDILSELDYLRAGWRFMTRGGRKLVIVDDAQNLKVKDELRLEHEARDGSARFIVIETDYHADKDAQTQNQGDTAIRVNLSEFISTLTPDFFGNPVLSQDANISPSDTKERENSFKEAISGVAEGKIRDIWHFNFVATRGEEKLTNELQRLSRVEVLVLFLISARTVMSGELEISTDYLLNQLSILRKKLAWLDEELKSTSCREILNSLQMQTSRRKSLIRVRQGTHVTCLHYRFARAVVRTIMNTGILSDILEVTSELPDNDFANSGYVSILLRDIGSASLGLIEKRLGWFLDFLNNPLATQLSSYTALLRQIKISFPDHDQLIRRLDVDGMARKASLAKPAQFQQIGQIGVALDFRRDEFLNALDIYKLAETSKSIESSQFEQLAQVMNGLGERSRGLVSRLDFKSLAVSAGKASIKDLQQLVSFVKELGEAKEAFTSALVESGSLKRLAGTISKAPFHEFRTVALFLDQLDVSKASLVEALNFRALIEKAKDLNAGALSGLTYFLASLDEKDRNRLIREIDWTSLCLSCPIDADSLGVLGRCIKNLIQQGELTGEARGLEKIRARLHNSKDEIVNVINCGIVNSPEKNFGSVARLLFSCDLLDKELAREIANAILETRSANLRITRYNYYYVAQFIRSLHTIDRRLAKVFINQDAVRRKIFGFFRYSRFDWTRDVENLKFLIRWLYQSDPEAWRRIADNDLIALALNPIDLTALYREVNELENSHHSGLLMSVSH